MAFYDPHRRAVTLRIIYDGLGTAGKTTNVRKIHELFTLARSGEVVVPEERKGRTLFFDWLELDAGFVCDDIPLRCQILTVPGQFAYAHRRWQILRSPDAIVEVCDSSPQGVVRSRYAMRFLRAMLAEGDCKGVPLIVQANKQDVPGALSGEELCRALDLDPSVRVVEAVASEGVGVRSTVVFALQAARERARALLDLAGIEALESFVESAEDLYQHMLRVEDSDTDLDGDRLTDLILREAEGESQVGDATAALDPSSGGLAETPPHGAPSSRTS